MAGAPTDPVLRSLDRLFRSGTLGGATDGHLLQQFVDGDEGRASAAFAALVERHGPMVLRVCRRVLDNPHDAEDASQATFLVLARKARSVRRRDSVASWLFGAAYKVSRRARVASARRREHERRGGEMAALRGADDNDSGRREGWPDLYEELDRLPETYRAPIVLHHLEGLTLAEAAGRLGWPLRTLQRRLAQGRERLRLRLSRRGMASSFGLLLGTSLGAEAASGAEMPAALAEAIVRAAVRPGAGGAATAGAVSASVEVLAEGALRMMFWSKLRSGAAFLVALAGVTTLTAGLAWSLTGPDPGPAPPPEDKPKAPPLKRAYDGPFPAAADRRVLNLQVADDATGAALADAQVHVLEFVDLKFHEFPTDAQGRLRVMYPFINEPDVSVEVRKEGYVPQRYGNEPGRPLPASLSVRLRAATTIGGTVVDEEGAPIAGALVVVTVSGYNEPRTRPKIIEGYEITFEVPVTTDADGRWRCRQISPDASKVTLQLMHPDYVSNRTTMPGPTVRLPAVADLRNLSDRQIMKRGVRVAGRVLDPEGRAIAGAEVTDTTNGEPYLLFQRRATTDADGRFHLHFDPRERVALTARAKGRAPVGLAVRAGTAKEPLEIRLGPGRAIRGKVADPRGKPLAGAMVWIRGISTHKGIFLRTWTDAEGRFRWDEAPDEPVPLTFDAVGHMTVDQPIRPSDREVVVVLKPALTVTISVRDSGTGAAVKHFEIEAGVVEPETDEVRWDRSLTQTVNDGECRLRVDGMKPTYRFRIRAPGHEPFLSRVLRGDEGKVAYDVRLERRNAPGLSGLVRLPDGAPLAGAEVVAGGVRIRKGTPQNPERLIRAVTDAEGRFTLPPAEENFPLAVLSDRGFAEVSRGEWDTSKAITVRPWGRVEGLLRIGSRPGAHRKVELIVDRLRDRGERLVDEDEETTTDAEGRFALEKVIPGKDVRLFHDVDPEGKSRSYGALIEVKPGETTRVALGGRGRPVIGRIVQPEGAAPGADYRNTLRIELASDRPRIPFPNNDPRGVPPNWERDWWSSEEGRAYRRATVSLHVDASGTDGTFRFEDVPEGAYRLVIEASATPFVGVLARLPANLKHTFTVPEIPGGQSDEPFDLGPLRPTLKQALKEGQPAPPLVARTLDGRALDLKDYRGKYVLLDFWATWCGPCIAELPHLKEVHEAFGRDERFAMISLSLDDKAEEPRAFVAKQQLGWTQGFLGPWSESDVAKAYHVEAIPAILLIGPDGRVVAAGLRREQIRSAVASALSSK